jgi:hypothetical protein
VSQIHTFLFAVGKRCDALTFHKQFALIGYRHRFDSDPIPEVWCRNSRLRRSPVGYLTIRRRTTFARGGGGRRLHDVVQLRKPDGLDLH